MDYNKILIVDDDREFSQELRETLYLCGFGVRVLSEGAHVVKTARKLKPHAILLDLRMSGSSGFEVAQSLKSDKETAGIPIIAMSGYFPIDNQNALLEMRDMDGRIKKPFDVSDLLTEIESVLKTRNS